MFVMNLQRTNISAETYYLRLMQLEWKPRQGNSCRLNSVDLPYQPSEEAFFALLGRLQHAVIAPDSPIAKAQQYFAEVSEGQSSSSPAFFPPPSHLVPTISQLSLHLPTSLSSSPPILWSTWTSGEWVLCWWRSGHRVCEYVLQNVCDTLQQP